jgi:hypothetical protein
MTDRGVLIANATEAILRTMGKLASTVVFIPNGTWQVRVNEWYTLEIIHFMFNDIGDVYCGYYERTDTIYVCE